MRISAERLWEQRLKNEDPDVMAFIERLANLLQPQLDRCEGTQRLELLERILRPMLRKAGAERLSENQLQRAFLTLHQCWAAYAVVVDKALEEAGLLSSGS